MRVARCWASTLAPGAIMQDATQLWLRPRMQSCDQYGRILLVSGVISKKSPQRSASFRVRFRSGVARGRLWREAAVKAWQFYATSDVLGDATRFKHKSLCLRKAARLCSRAQVWEETMEYVTQTRSNNTSRRAPNVLVALGTRSHVVCSILYRSSDRNSKTPEF